MSNRGNLLFSDFMQTHAVRAALLSRSAGPTQPNFPPLPGALAPLTTARMTRTQPLRGNVGNPLHAFSPSREPQLRRRFPRPSHENGGYRPRQVRACPDNAFIPRVPEAGQMVDGYQIMHNG